MRDVCEKLALIALGAGQPLGHRIERAGEPGELLRPGGSDSRAEVAAREPVCRRNGPFDRAANGARDHRGGSEGSEDHEQDHAGSDQREGDGGVAFR